jgi:hypothetical protein
MRYHSGLEGLAGTGTDGGPRGAPKVDDGAGEGAGERHQRQQDDHGTRTHGSDPFIVWIDNPLRDVKFRSRVGDRAPEAAAEQIAPGAGTNVRSALL